MHRHTNIIRWKSIFMICLDITLNKNDATKPVNVEPIYIYICISYIDPSKFLQWSNSLTGFSIVIFIPSISISRATQIGFFSQIDDKMIILEFYDISMLHPRNSRIDWTQKSTTFYKFRWQIQYENLVSFIICKKVQKSVIVCNPLLSRTTNN